MASESEKKWIQPSFQSSDFLKENYNHETSSVPEGATHVIPQGKDIFFVSGSLSSGSGSENVYQVRKAFYAEDTRTAGPWGYFKIVGIGPEKHPISVWRDGEHSVVTNTVFKIKLADTSKIQKKMK